jgi:hypothetical protein
MEGFNGEVLLRDGSMQECDIIIYKYNIMQN